MAAAPASASLAILAGTGLPDFCQAAAPALWLIEDLPDEALLARHAELDHHIDQQIQQTLDIAAGELPPCGTLLDQEHQLLEGELAAAGVNARDRARVTRVDVAQVVEGLFRAHLREQNERLVLLGRQELKELLLGVIERDARAAGGAKDAAAGELRDRPDFLAGAPQRNRDRPRRRGRRQDDLRPLAGRKRG